MDVRVKYALGDSGLTMDYLAHSDRDTVCNLTNHSYFNLNGHGNGTVEDHHVMINSDRHTVFGGRSCPRGRSHPSKGRPWTSGSRGPSGPG